MAEKSLRVLLLDDEASLREPLAEYLVKNYHYAVDAAGEVSEAMHLIESAKGRYDVALVDEVLGEDPSGIEVLKQIKAKYPDIEVILFTGWGIQSGIEALRAGAYRYFAKPFNPEELALTIRFAAEQGRIRQKQQYMTALVEASRRLTQTTRQDEQLTIVWDFVREQLEVSTFFIALYDQESDTIHFPLAYEEGNSVQPPSRILGNDPSQWGLTGYVAETGNEIHCSTHEEFEQISQSLGIKPFLDGRPTQSIFYFPLQVEGKILGAISVQSFQPYAFNPVLLDAVRALGNQVATALENGRLFTQAEQKARDAERQANNLKSLQNLALTISSSLESHEILTRTCQAAVELFKVDHSSLVFFDDQLVQGRVEAEYPALGAVGTLVQLRGAPGAENFIATRKPLIVNDVATAESFGPVREIWLGLGIPSIMIVPIISKGKLLGSLGLDAIQQPRQFTPEEVQLCETFAAQVAVAIENARLFEETQRRANQLEALRRTTLAITSPLDRDTLLSAIVQQAVDLLGAKSGGIFEYYSERSELTVIADYNRPGFVGKTQKVGEGMAGRLVQSDEPFKIVDDYNEWHGRSDIYADGRPFGAVLEVALKWQEDIIGVLYVDDEVGRKFTPEDARLLGLFADQAAIALANTDLITKNEEKLRRLEKLSKATKEITSNLGSMTLDELLTLIAKHATEILEAEVCGVSLVKREGFLSLEASYGHREGSFPKGWEIAICSGPKTGLTGHIAYEGRLFNAHGDALINHFAIRGIEPEHLPSGKCYSLLAIPLKKKVGEEEKLVGLLRAENKKQNGRALPTLSFTKEDEWILNIFAESVVVALDSAQLVGQLNEQKDHLELLLKASHTLALAESLTEGLESLAEMVVSLLIHTFCRILLLDESGEFLVVEAAYPVPRSGERPNWDLGLGKRTAVSEWQGLRRVLEAGSPTVLRWNDERVQPVLARSSRWLGLEENVQSLLMVPLKMRNRVVGLLEVGEARGEKRARFTDAEIELASAIAAETTALIDRMRLYEMTERRRAELEHLHEASEAMAGAFDLKEVLQTIVEKVRSILQADSSAIWSYDHIRDKFVLEEVVAAGIPDEELQKFRNEEPKPGRTAYTVMEKGWIGVMDVSSSEFDYLGQPTRELLDRIGVTSFEGIALKVGDEPVGVLYVNYKQPRVFGEEDRRSLENLATYAALSLKRARLLDQVSKAKKTAEVVAQVTALGDLRATLASIAQGTQEAVGCDAVTLYVYDQTTGRLEHPPTMAGVRYPDSVVRLAEVLPDSIVYTMLRRDEPYIVEDVATDDLFKDRRFARDECVVSCVAIPLKLATQKVGLMFVNYRIRHRFTVDELTNIELFANQAAVAIRNAQLYQQLQQQYDELKRVKGLVGARTALAWMGMTSSVWGHAIARHALTIREQSLLLRRDLEHKPSGEKISRANERITIIEHLANQVLEKPMTPVLSAEEGASSVPLNPLVRERVLRLWQSEPYRSARLQLDLTLPDTITVRANPDWLRRALDVLIDNAVDAVSESPVKQVTVASRLVGESAEITVSDSGKGISEEVLDKLFVAPIPKPTSARGLGMGLLMAQAIVQTYGGDLRLADTGSTGTTMVISLPLER